MVNNFWTLCPKVGLVDKLSTSGNENENGKEAMPL
jgi:hypothetical protein